MGQSVGRERLSARNDTFQVIESLKSNRRSRARRKLIFVEGVAPINAAVSAGLAAEMLVVPRRKRLSGWANDMIGRFSPCRVVEVDEPLFAELSERGTPSEMLAILERPDTGLPDINIAENSVVAILDRPSNHGNLGSILRTAEAFGVAAVVTTGHCVDHHDPAVIRASLGAVFTTPVIHEPSSVSLVAWIDSLKRQWPELVVLGTDSLGSVPLSEAPTGKPLVALFGNEATGLSPTMREAATAIAAIPVSGHVDSLNLACAASIVLYSACSPGGRSE
jgi:TrmH family RNA methyltransferase